MDVVSNSSNLYQLCMMLEHFQAKDMVLKRKGNNCDSGEVSFVVIIAVVEAVEKCYKEEHENKIKQKTWLRMLNVKRGYDGIAYEININSSCCFTK